MFSDTHAQRILSLARQKGLLRASDLDAIEAPRVVLTRLIEGGLLERVSRGLYRLPSHPGSEHEGLATVAAKVPQAVFCLLTALQFHELTTQLPRQVWIAMPRGSHVPRLDYPPIKMVQMTGAVYTAGIEEHLRDGVTLRIPKALAAEIFRTVPSWWWRTPKSPPQVPVHLLTASDSIFYQHGFPQLIQQQYRIPYSVVEGGHMFPLEIPEATAATVQALIHQQAALNISSKVSTSA